MQPDTMIFDLDEDFSSSLASSPITRNSATKNDEFRIRESSITDSDSMYSVSPTNSIDDNLLSTPICQHHFMYDSKFMNSSSKCNCKSANKSVGIQMESPFEAENSSFFFQEQILDTTQKFVKPTSSSIFQIPIKSTSSNGEFFETKIENSFHIAKDNYRLWLTAARI